MRNRLIIGFGILILMVVLSFGWLYFYGGLRYYLKAGSLINQSKASAGNKDQIRQDFYGDKAYPKDYRGTLAMINNNGIIWVWGRSGLKYFKMYKDSVLHFSDGCFYLFTNNVAENAGRIYEIKDQVFTDITKWSEKASVGDYVIVSSRTKIGLFGGYVGEAFTHNNWFFLQTNNKITCRR